MTKKEIRIQLALGTLDYFGLPDVDYLCYLKLFGSRYEEEIVRIKLKMYNDRKRN